MPDAAPAGSTLAARCTACSTVFRVVPDQLRVSDGWVRCGRCSEVFNAAENLIDLDTGAPRRLDLSGTRPGAASAGPHPPVPDDAFSDDAMATTEVLAGPAPDRTSPDVVQIEPGPVTVHVNVPEAEIEPELTVLRRAEDAAVDLTAAATATANARSAGDVDAAQPEPRTPLAPESAPEAASPPASASATAADPEPAAAAEPAIPLPSFVRHADRAARWRQPRVRAALASGVVVAALLLAAQVAITYRDVAAARWPGLRPVLEAGCRPLGCRVGPAQSIDALTVESSGLVRVEQTRLYELTVSLRNRAALDLAVPAVEVSLTDAQGRLLSRRVLQPADLGVALASVAAGRDLALQTTLQTAPLSTPPPGDDSEGVVAGYTIELFYP